jgi:hypothetical protein
MADRTSPKILLIAPVLLLCIHCASATGDVIYVDDDANLGGDGQTWETAYRHLQDALYAADPCDEIWVAEGTYKPDQDEGGNTTPGQRGETFQLISGAAVYGGFSRGQDSIEDREPSTYETILSGDLDGNDTDVNDPCELLFEPTRGENSYHVVTGSGTDSNTILDGFTITAGNADDGESEGYGGGMFNYQGSPTVRNCMFTSNSAYWSGGAVYVESGSPTLTDCGFINNGAAEGGGMSNKSSGPLLTNCAFTWNWADWHGGAICNHNHSSPRLTRCTLEGNGAEYYGGGICNLWDCNATLTNCNLTGNFATAWDSWSGGGGMYNEYSNPTLVDCLMQENDGAYGGGMWNFGSSPNLIDCMFTGR